MGGGDDDRQDDRCAGYPEWRGCIGWRSAHVVGVGHEEREAKAGDEGHTGEDEWDHHALRLVGLGVMSMTLPDRAIAASSFAAKSMLT